MATKTPKDILPNPKPEDKQLDDLDKQLLENLQQLLGISPNDEEKALLVEDLAETLTALIDLRCLVLLRDGLNDLIKAELP